MDSSFDEAGDAVSSYPNYAPLRLDADPTAHFPGMPKYSTIFLIQSHVFLVGMVLISLVLAWLLSVNPFQRIHFNWIDIAFGSITAAVMLAVFSWVKDPREHAEKLLGPIVSELSWATLIWLALFVGFAEELLFRGVLEPWLARWNPVVALIAVNILFGALHKLSLQYAIVAGLLGGLMSLLAYGPGGDNLLRPMVTHAVYDFLGFAWIAHTWKTKANSQQIPPGIDAQSATDLPIVGCPSNPDATEEPTSVQED